MHLDFYYAFPSARFPARLHAGGGASFALGIGANAAIFSLDTLWFRPLPVPNASRIVRVVSTSGQEPPRLVVFVPEFARNVPVLRDLVAVGGRGISFVSGDKRQLLLMTLVSPDFFTTLGVKPATGRFFTPRDEASGGLLVVLGNSFWHRFGGDSAVVGRQIRLQRVREVLATLIGVLAASLRDTQRGDRKCLVLVAARSTKYLMASMPAMDRMIPAANNRSIRAPAPGCSP